MLKRIPSYIPKRNKLKEDGRIIELTFHQCMTSKETTELITDAFKELARGKNCNICKQIAITPHATRLRWKWCSEGCGSLYVQQMEMEESDDDLPSIHRHRHPLPPQIPIKGCSCFSVQMN